MKLLQVAFTRPIVISSLRVAVVVGSVLNAINQGPAILSGQGASWPHVLLNFLVPYCVATYSGSVVEIRRGDGQ
jgi:hypothetical protein